MKIDIQKFPQNIKMQTSAAINCGYLRYNSSIRMAAFVQVINNTTKTYSNVATDGTHIWLRANNKTTVKYNGVTPTFVRDGNIFRITIPDNYDPTIPFVF